MDNNLWLFLGFGAIPIMVSLLFTGLIFLINGYYELGMVYSGGFVVLGLICGAYYCYLKLIERNEKY